MVMFGVDSGQALLIFIVISRMFAGFVEPILLHSVGIQFQSIYIHTDIGVVLKKPQYLIVNLN